MAGTGGSYPAKSILLSSLQPQILPPRVSPTARKIPRVELPLVLYTLRVVNYFVVSNVSVDIMDMQNA